MNRGIIRGVSLFWVSSSIVGCIDKDSAQKAIEAVQSSSTPKPDQLPRMRSRPEEVFRYPASLYSKKVQGNVTLRIYIDSVGSVRVESTAVMESSGYSALDSAAVTASRQLSFEPARLHGTPVGTAILLPVFFRYPGSAPLPGDTILRRRRAP